MAMGELPDDRPSHDHNVRSNPAIAALPWAEDHPGGWHRGRGTRGPARERRAALRLGEPSQDRARVAAGDGDQLIRHDGFKRAHVASPQLSNAHATAVAVRKS